MKPNVEGRIREIAGEERKRIQHLQQGKHVIRAVALNQSKGGVRKAGPSVKAVT